MNSVTARLPASLCGHPHRAVRWRASGVVPAAGVPPPKGTGRGGAVTFSETSTDPPRPELEALVTHSADVIAVLDGEGVVTYETPSIERVLGYDPSDLVGERALDYVQPDDGDGLRPADRRPDRRRARVDGGTLRRRVRRCRFAFSGVEHTG